MFLRDGRRDRRRIGQFAVVRPAAWLRVGRSAQRSKSGCPLVLFAHGATARERSAEGGRERSRESGRAPLACVHGGSKTGSDAGGAHLTCDVALDLWRGRRSEGTSRLHTSVPRPAKRRGGTGGGEGTLSLSVYLVCKKRKFLIRTSRSAPGVVTEKSPPRRHHRKRGVPPSPSPFAARPPLSSLGRAFSPPSPLARAASLRRTPRCPTASPALASPPP